MVDDSERRATNVVSQNGVVFISGAVIPLSMSPEDALALSDQLFNAATTAVGQQAIAKLRSGVEWI